MPFELSNGDRNHVAWKSVGDDPHAMEPIRFYFDSVADNLDSQSEFSSDPEFRSTLMDGVDVGANDSILDVGTGTGNCALYFMQRSSHVLGVDMSPRMLAVAKRKGVQCICADARALPFANRSFDLLVCRQLLYYFSRIVLVRVLGELHRIVKPTGRLLVNQNVPFTCEDRHFLNSLMCVQGLDLHYLTLEELAAVLRETGFQVTRWSDIIRPITESLDAFCSSRKLSIDEGRRVLIELQRTAPASYQLELSENQVMYHRRYVVLHAMAGGEGDEVWS